jgi:hypothetical protein
VAALEQATLWRLAPRKGGRPQSPQLIPGTTASLLLPSFQEAGERPVCPRVSCVQLENVI